MRALLTVLLIAVLVPGAAAELVLEDPEGDAVRRTVAGPGGEGPAAADLLSLRLDAREDLHVAIAHAGAPEDEAIDTLVRFRHGIVRYLAVVGEGAELWVTDEAGVRQRHVASLEGGRNGTEAAFRLPYDLARDEHGAPLASMQDVVVDARARDPLQGPDPDQGFFCCTAWWTAEDRMPDNGTGGHAFASDAARLRSDAPSRASNGGGDRFVYTLVATGGSTGLQGALAFDDVPEGWNATGPEGTLALAPGEEASFPVVVETSPHHRHGGTERLSVRLGDARASIGVHYLDVPQPTGHHPRLYLHSEPEPGMFGEAGYAPGRTWMSALPAEEGVPVDSTHSSFAGDEARWSICLAEGLQVALAQDLERTGALQATFSSGRPYGNVTLEGALYHYGAGAPVACDADAYREEREETVVARLAPTTHPLDGPTAFEADLVPVTERLPYEQGAMLLLELVARFEVPDTQAPGPLALEPGGSLRLPLLEHQDDPVPAMPVWHVAAAPAPTTTPTAESPVPWALLPVLAALAWRRRR